VDNFLIAERVRELAEKSVSGKKLELVHVEVFGPKGKPTIRVLIDTPVDTPEGITHDHCAEVSAAISEILDDEDFISSAYILEVSSPGIERGLYTVNDFEKFAGNLAKIKMKVPIEGQRNFRGTIEGVEDDAILLEDTASGLVRLGFSEIAKASLEIDFEKELGKKSKR